MEILEWMISSCPMIYVLYSASESEALQSVKPLREAFRPPLRVRGHVNWIPQPALLLSLSHFHHPHDVARTLSLLSSSNEGAPSRLVDSVCADFDWFLHGYVHFVDCHHRLQCSKEYDCQ